MYFHSLNCFAWKSSGVNFGQISFLNYTEVTEVKKINAQSSKNNKKGATKGFSLFQSILGMWDCAAGGEWKTNFNQSMFGSNGNLTSLDYRWHWIHFWDWNPIWKSSWLHSHWASLRWKHFLFRKWFSFHWKKSVRGQKFHKQFVAHSSFEFQIEYLNCSRPCTTH